MSVKINLKIIKCYKYTTICDMHRNTFGNRLKPMYTYLLATSVILTIRIYYTFI